MYHAVEPLPGDTWVIDYIDLLSSFADVSKLLSHNPGACAPPLWLILVQLPCAPCCSTSTFDLDNSPYLLSVEALAMKTARFVLPCHSVGTSLPEIALSVWMSASSFASSLQCDFTLTTNVDAPAVVLFQSSSIAFSKMSTSGAPTVSHVAFPPSRTHLFTAFSRAWFSHK